MRDAFRSAGRGSRGLNPRAHKASESCNASTFNNELGNLVMRDPRPLGYCHEPPTNRFRPQQVMSAVLLFLAVFIYLLFELQRLPYRPPEGMSTFLGAREIELVRALMIVLAVVWVAVAGALGAVVWVQRRSPKRNTAK